MKRPIKIVGSALALAVGAVAVTSLTATGAMSAATPFARVQVASFAVANMTCATCPITVKKAMSAVHGVRSVKVDLESKTATVEFDPKVTNIAMVAAASTNAGFPAKPRG
jgi:periplasmic mercuric ion binding protein